MADVIKKKKTDATGVALPSTTNYYNRINTNPTNSQEASAALGNVINNAPGQYKPSEAVQNAYSQLQDTLNNRPADYQSQYSDTIKGLLDNILNQKDFSYDFNKDALYQNYKNQYMQQGKQSMLDTQAAASSLNGGFGSSYATSAASQAYQQYLTQLNDKIPELYNLALQKYQMDTDKMYNQLSAVGNQEDREYGQYRDTVSDWKDDRSYGLNQYNTMYNQDYGAYRDQVSDYYNDRDYYAGRQDSIDNKEQQEKEFAYRQYRDSISDSQWQQTFDYNKNRDAVSDSQWQQSFDYNKNRDAVSDSQWQQNFDYNKGRDEVSDSQWQQTFDYNKERDTISDQQWEKQYALSKYNAYKSSGSSSSKNSDYEDGKKLTSTIQEQIQSLDGTELDNYLGSLVAAGYSYTAIEDYLTQLGKEIEDDQTEKTNNSSAWLENDVKNYRNRLQRSTR